FKACLFLSAGSVIHSIHEQQMPKMGGLRKKLPYTFIAMFCCSLAIAGVPFFSGFVSKDRILGDALYWGFMAGQNPMLAIVPILGFAGAFLTAFYMFRMIFLTFFGTPRDQHIYDHAHQEHLSFTSNVPLLILTVFTLGFWYAGSLTGQGIVNVMGAKTEWFKILVEAPQVEKFVGSEAKKTPFIEPTTYTETLPVAVLDGQTGYAGPNPDEHKIHSAHVIGAVASIIIALTGIFLAFLMYVKGAIKPLAPKFPGYVRTLQNRYYFDKVYQDIVIKKGLLGLNRLLAWFDMGIYDRFAVDGWAKVNRVLFRIAKWFDNVVIDAVGVDGAGVAVNLFNLVLRIVQSGKIQFYFIMLIVVLCSYIWTLNF
ncbi:MAG: proton-conducting transporter membrane subunit, partial [Candidatus Caldatribacteriota bacterium]